ncbi:MAG: hypothetical protein ABFS35_23125 [Bacteroidota bacterium]
MTCLIIVSILWLPILAAAETGRICVAPLPEFRGHPEPPPELVLTDSTASLYVKIDEREPIKILMDNISWINDIDTKAEHSIAIYRDSTPIESFRFNMSQFSFTDKNRKDLCLSLGDFYFTWQLREVEKTGDWCPCWSSAEDQ